MKLPLLIALWTSLAQAGGQPPLFSAQTSFSCNEVALDAAKVVKQVALSSDGQYFVHLYEDGSLTSGVSRNGSDLHPMQLEKGGVAAVQFLKGDHIFAVIQGNRMQLRRATDGTEVNHFDLGSTLIHKRKPVTRIEFSEDGFHVALIDDRPKLTIYHTMSGKIVGAVDLKSDKIRAFALANTGRHYLLSYEKETRVYAGIIGDDGEILDTFDIGIQEHVNRVAIAPGASQWLCVTESGILWQALAFRPSKTSQTNWTNTRKLNFGMNGEIADAQYLMEGQMVLIKYNAPSRPQLARYYLLRASDLNMTHEFAVPWQQPITAIVSDLQAVHVMGQPGTVGTYSQRNSP